MPMLFVERPRAAVDYVLDSPNARDINNGRSSGASTENGLGDEIPFRGVVAHLQCSESQQSMKHESWVLMSSREEK
jgi:hypothetical protein